MQIYILEILLTFLMLLFLLEFRKTLHVTGVVDILLWLL